MPISSELISTVPRTAPEGLIEHVCKAGHLGTGGFVISACWVEDLYREVLCCWVESPASESRR